MGLDYYLILKIHQSATDAEIKKAYRKLSLKNHPYNNPDNQAAAEKFQVIAEAYDVLVDPRKRAIYDQFGEEGLKHGVPPGTMACGAWTSGYIFHGHADKVFRDFFGGDNPFQEYYDRLDGDLVMSFGGLHGRGHKKQDDVIERELALTLEETFHGCIKKMKISRRVMNDDEVTSCIRDKILTIVVKMGWLPGTRITFANEGDQGPNSTAADVVFILRDKPHPYFKRDGVNLIYTADVLLRKALTTLMLEIHTLDERILHIPINDVVRPGYKKIVPGEGMPHVKHIDNEPTRKGDLIIEFNIEFPRVVTRDERKLVYKALPDKTLKPTHHDEHKKTPHKADKKKGKGDKDKDKAKKSPTGKA